MHLKEGKKWTVYALDPQNVDISNQDEMLKLPKMTTFCALFMTHIICKHLVSFLIIN